MKRKLTFKSLLLVAAMLLGGVNSAWAENVGATNKGWADSGSYTFPVELASNETMTYTFSVTETSSSNNFAGYALNLSKTSAPVENNENAYLFYRSSDLNFHIGTKNWGDGAVYTSDTYGEVGKKDFYTGAIVVLTVKRVDTYVYVSGSVTKDGTTYNHYLVQDLNTKEKIYTLLAADYAVLNLTSSTVTDSPKEIIGQIDFKSPITSGSNISLKQGETKVITFNNYGSTGESWFNWTIVAKEDVTERASVRADSYDNTSKAATNITSYQVASERGGVKTNLDWDTFKSDMTNAKVTALVSYGVDGKLTIKTTSECSSGRIYYVDHQATGLVGGDLTLNIFVNQSWVEILSVTDPVEVYGAIDYTSGFMATGDHKDFTISKGEKIKVNFQNFGKGDSQWFNWLVRLSGATGVDQTLRADNYVLGDADSNVSTRSITQNDGGINWETFNTEMQNAAVELIITYAADGKFSIQAVDTGKDNTFTHNFSYNSDLNGTVNVELGVEKAWIEVNSAEKYALATLGTNGYATFANGNALDLSKLPDGLTAWKASVSDTNVNFTKVIEAVPANTGLLLWGEAGETYDILVASSASLLTGNAFVVNTSGAVFDAESGFNYYGMNKNSNPLTFGQFNPASVAIPANKAYLKVSSTAAHQLTTTFDEESTGIGATLNDNGEMTNDKPVYNLAGQRVSKPAKGLYIVSGKKYIVK